MGPGCFYPGNEHPVVCQHLVHAASMGPGCFYPGNNRSFVRTLEYLVASMGPGCFYPGNLSSPVASTTASMLQWGRDVSIPEICDAAGSYQRLAASMGPGCFYPGNQPVPLANGNLSIRFNGAGMFLSRKFCCGACRCAMTTGFNGAGMFLSRKCRRALGNVQEISAASMGPGCFYPGNLIERLMRKVSPELQWGRDVSIPEMMDP